jgi:hypothetical protein
MDLGPGAGVLGTYVNRPVIGFNPAININIYALLAGYTWLPAGAESLEYATNALDVFWADPLGGADLGIHLNYGGVYNNTFQSANWGLSLGLGFANVGAFSEGNIHADLLEDKILDTATNTRDNGVYTAALGTLWVAGVDTDDSLRLFGDMNLSGYHFNDDDEMFNMLDLGLSLNRKINGGKGLLATGLVLDYLGYKYDQENETIDDWEALWDASLESQVADWLTLRAGIETALVARDYDSTNAPTFLDSAQEPVGFSFGFGINWENWTLNASTSVNSFESTISNVQPGNGIFFSGNLMTVSVADLRYKF